MWDPLTIQAAMGLTGFVVWLLWPLKHKLQRTVLMSPTDEGLDVASVVAAATGKQYLVIGTGGVGSKLIHTLIKRGETKIRAFDLRIPKEFEDHPVVEFVTGDVRDKDKVLQAHAGVDVVFATFAIIRFMDSLPHQWDLSFSINVQGTKNVIDACCQQGVRHLVQTSTSNVCAYKQWLFQTKTVFPYDEEMPHCTRDNSINHYAVTKAIAEELVLKADGTPLAKGGHLQTVSLRPCSGIFGPRDNFLAQKAMEDNKVVFVVPESVLDMVFVDNVVLAHILAADKLDAGAPEVAGQAFGISNGGPPISVGDFYMSLQKFFPSMTFAYMPRGVTKCICTVVSALQGMLGARCPDLGEVGMLNWTALGCMLMSYELKSDKAERLLGYTPLFSLDQGLMRTAKEFKAGKYL